jgi:hypothetical protein
VRFRAWPPAWPSPSGPLGRQRSPGSMARRRRVARQGHEVKVFSALSRGSLAHVVSPVSRLVRFAGRQRQHTSCRHARFARVDKRVRALTTWPCVARSAMRSTIDAGGGRPAQCAAFRPADCDLSSGDRRGGVRVTAGPARAARHWALRRGPAAAGARAAVRGSRRVRRASVRRTRAKLPPQRRDSRQPQPPTTGHPGCSTFPRLPVLALSATPRPSGPARRRRALETVEIVIAAPGRGQART